MQAKAILFFFRSPPPSLSHFLTHGHSLQQKGGREKEKEREREREREVERESVAGKNDRKVSVHSRFNRCAYYNNVYSYLYGRLFTFYMYCIAQNIL
jgi:hypothetical protein